MGKLRVTKFKKRVKSEANCYGTELYALVTQLNREMAMPVYMKNIHDRQRRVLLPSLKYMSSALDRVFGLLYNWDSLDRKEYMMKKAKKKLVKAGNFPLLVHELLTSFCQFVTWVYKQILDSLLFSDFFQGAAWRGGYVTDGKIRRVTDPDDPTDEIAKIKFRLEKTARVLQRVGVSLRGMQLVSNFLFNVQHKLFLYKQIYYEWTCRCRALSFKAEATYIEDRRGWECFGQPNIEYNGIVRYRKEKTKACKDGVKAREQRKRDIHKFFKEEDFYFEDWETSASECDEEEDYFWQEWDRKDDLIEQVLRREECELRDIKECETPEVLLLAEDFQSDSSNFNSDSCPSFHGDERQQRMFLQLVDFMKDKEAALKLLQGVEEGNNSCDSDEIFRVQSIPSAARIDSPDTSTNRRWPWRRKGKAKPTDSAASVENASQLTFISDCTGVEEKLCTTSYVSDTNTQVHKNTREHAKKAEDVENNITKILQDFL